MGGIPWFIAGEINTPENLGPTNSLAGSLNWLMSFSIVLAAKNMI
jgi:hypothetical protein